MVAIHSQAPAHAQAVHVRQIVFDDDQRGRGGFRRLNAASPISSKHRANTLCGSRLGEHHRQTGIRDPHEHNRVPDRGSSG